MDAETVGAELRQTYRDGIIADVMPVLTGDDATKAALIKVLTDHLDESIPEVAGLRAVAAKAWDEGFTERGNQDQIQRRDRFHALARVNPYRQPLEGGTP